MKIQACLPLLRQVSHPFGPYDLTVVVDIEFLMPLQSPELFETNRSHGEIHKQTVDTALMAIDAVTGNALFTAYSVSCLWRGIRMLAKAPQPAGIQEQGDIVGVAHIGAGPVPALLRGARVRGRGPQAERADPTGRPGRSREARP